MPFAEKISQLMKLVGLSNKAMSEALQIDASLISRWRTGDRVPQKNSAYYQQLGAFFAHRITDYQKISLLAMMNLPLNLAGSKELELAELISDWLSRQENTSADPTREIIEKFLLKADLIDRYDALSGQDYYTDEPRGEVAASELFHGLQGMRDASFKLMRTLLSLDEPHTLYMFSDQRLEWMNNDLQYDNMWRRLTARCLQKGHRFCVIHDVSRSYAEMFTTIERWLPLYLTGQVDTYFCPRHIHNTYCSSINLIPGQAAVFSHCAADGEENAEYAFITNQATLDSLFASIRQQLSASEPLFRIFTPKTAKQLQDEHLHLLYSDGNTICLNNVLTSITMPEPLFNRIISRMVSNSTERRSLLEMFRLKQKIFFNNLKSYTYREIMILPEPHQVKKQGLTINLTMFMGTQGDEYASYEEIKEHIAHVTWLLENQPNYQCYLMHEGIFKNLQIQAKENRGVVFTSELDSYYTFFLSQHSMTAAFYNYLESSLSSLPQQGHDRAYTIAKLKDYLAL